jgi:hypothetical protein
MIAFSPIKDYVMDVFDCWNLISFLFDLGVRGAVSSLISSYVTGQKFSVK